MSLIKALFSYILLLNMNGTIEHHCSEGYADGNRETAWDISWNKNMRNRIIMGSLMEWLRGWSNQAKWGKWSNERSKRNREVLRHKRQFQTKRTSWIS